jgi:hypothetical protein
LGTNGGGLGAADFSFLFGDLGDTPFVGDFDGDGVDTFGLYRESAGIVYFRDSLSTGIADAFFYYGIPDDTVLAADWNGDGIDTVAVYRRSNNTLFVNLENAPGPADWSAVIGTYNHVVSAR